MPSHPRQLLLALTLAGSVATPAAGQTVGAHAGLRWSGNGTCLPCHGAEAREVHASSHYQWEGLAPDSLDGPAMQGKKRSAVNSYCVNILGNWTGCSNCHVGRGKMPTATATSTQLKNIDCLVCHQEAYKRKRSAKSGLFVPDTAAMTISMDQAVRTVHRPTRATCLQCHAKGGGGDNYKRGDLAMAQVATTDRTFDVHMATTGANLRCQDCHAVSAHRIAGRGSDLRQTDHDVAMSCSTSACHPTKASGGHGSSALNLHVQRVACQTCHVGPLSARNAADTAATEATEVHRDWSRPHLTPSGAWHPLPTMANNIKPVYRFWNSKNDHYNFLEIAGTDPVTSHYNTSRPLGSIDDTTTASKLYPFKYKTALQPYATTRATLVTLDTSKYFAGLGLTAAVESGLVNMGFTAADPWTMVTSETYQLLTHEIAPKSASLICASCHGSAPTQMNLPALGYTLKGPRSTVCTQCHGREDDNLNWQQVHDKHVKDKKYDCSFCHAFTRPERGLRTTRGGGD